MAPLRNIIPGSRDILRWHLAHWRQSRPTWRAGPIRNTSGRGPRVAASQLQQRFESQAGNQQVAGLAALAAIRKAFPDLVDDGQFKALADRTLGLQHAEGWFTEYDGPDLGYLTVTMDCLWDLYDFTEDPVFYGSASRALHYLASFVDARPEAAGMHNARNTDYLVPYGIARFFERGGTHGQTARRIFAMLFGKADAADHPFAAVDDRYWCHYIGHSVLRCLSLPEWPEEDCKTESGALRVFFPGSGHDIRNADDSRCGAIVSLRKGGILTVFSGDGASASDYGWIIQTPRAEFVTHWWSNQWEIDSTDNSLSADGFVFAHKEQVSRPWKHFILRACSMLLGRRIIQLLKKAVIFKKGTASIRFNRRILLRQDGAEVVDTFTGLTGRETIRQAPRMSKRHVASADSYHREDLGLVRGFIREETRESSRNSLVIRTTYTRLTTSGADSGTSS